jgi:hypothetical protein
VPCGNNSPLFTQIYNWRYNVTTHCFGHDDSNTTNMTGHHSERVWFNNHSMTSACNYGTCQTSACMLYFKTWTFTPEMGLLSEIWWLLKSLKVGNSMCHSTIKKFKCTFPVSSNQSVCHMKTILS